MEIHSFLLDILKLIIPIATAILSISIAFIDKINLDLTIRQTRRAMISLWMSLIGTLIFAIATSFFVYHDVDYNKQSQKLSQLMVLNDVQIRALINSMIRNGDKTQEILRDFESLKEAPDIKRSGTVQTCFFLTLTGFLLSILQLIGIGFIIIKHRSMKKTLVDECHSLKTS